MEAKYQPKILRLAEETINQIAAGEVIENVASIAKELIENSCDAGANEIIIETIGEGRGMLVLKDNGEGIEKEELPLAIERHATSKIIDADGLFKLSTLGFRGEALASIAAVSKMKIHSSTHDGKGALLVVEGGKMISLNDLPRKRGTTIEVTSLFYNTPARKKFQKSLSSEGIELYKELTLNGLCHRNVDFEWIRDGKRDLFLRGQEARLRELLGEEFAENSVHVKADQGAYDLEAYFVKAVLHRPQRTSQYCFVNERPIVSQFIAKSVEEAYGTRLPTNRFPLFVLFLKVPPESIDVNIHPRKKEIRFHEEKLLEKLIHKAVEIGLSEKKEILPKVVFPQVKAFSLEDVIPTMRKIEEPTPKREIQMVTILGNYLFAKEQEDEILVVDAKRARARIFYERLGKGTSNLPVQRLLFPITIERPFLETSHLTALNDLGIAIRPFGGKSYLIEAYPDVFDEREVLSLIDEMPTQSLDNERKMKQMFCSKIKKRVHTWDEGVQLIEELFRCEVPEFCPEMRPTYRRVNEKEVAKWL